MPPLPKRYGKTLPPVINPDGRLCFKLSVPNTLEYRAALMGAVGTLGYWFTWQHTQADYTNIPERNIEAAELWTQVLSEAVWSECMEICEQIINCIVNDEDVQNALRDFVLGDEAINNYINNIASYQVLSAANRAENLLKPGACDPGFVFNQTSILVSLLNSLSTDLLQAIEVETNALERAELLVSAIPAVGGLFPVDELIGLAEQVAEEVYEGYEGDWDEALYDDIRCKIFCLVKDDCQLSIDTVITFYEGRLSESLPSDPVEMFVALLEYILLGSFPPDMAVYAMHLLVLAAIRLSQNVLGVDFATMGLRVIAAGDESDNDWEVLCTTCPPEPSECADLTLNDGGYEAVFPGRAIYHGDDPAGWGRGTVNASYMWLRRDFSGSTLTSVYLRLSAPLIDQGNVFVAIYAYDDTGQTAPIASSSDPFQEFTFGGISLSDGLIIYVSTNNLLPVDLRLVEICYEFAE